MTFYTDKDLKSKNSWGKKVYIFAKDVHSKRKFEIKAKETRHEKGLYFGCTLIQAVDVKLLLFFYKMCIL